jgi:hypothetical protein
MGGLSCGARIGEVPSVDHFEFTVIDFLADRRYSVAQVETGPQSRGASISAAAAKISSRAKH